MSASRRPLPERGLADAPPVALPVVHRGPLRAALVTARPRQWIKNALVVAAAGAAGALGRADVPQRVLIAFAAFCLLASGIYFVNDVRDAAEDRQHPRKRRRPVAAGQLAPRPALAIGMASMCAGLLACLALSPLLAVVAAGYLALTISYTLIWRHVLFCDLIAIAGGFVLRAVAGGVAAPVELSRWFLLVVTCAALFLAAGKRYAERLRPPAGGVARRRVLNRYSLAQLRGMLVGSGIGAIVAYAMWALAVPARHGDPWRELTLIPFCLALGRYGQVVRAGGAEAPEDVVLGDPPLIVAAGIWLVLFGLSVHAAA
ncbi:MAG: decaprenyl-phosphate phosphoribosyltransferase [Solirubrobacterales bacterium]|nr:decaprenyl-phosphate phosphoribosyltransferase [Solirubrobacterales bacterium]